MWSLTKEKIEKMKEQKTKLENEIAELKKMGIYDIWNKDLDDFEKLLNDTYEQE